MGPFYDGAIHLVVSPDDLLGVIALALLAGLNGRRMGRQMLCLLPASWVVGGCLGLLQSAEVVAPTASALSFLVPGVLLALDARLPRAALLALASLFGVFHGYLNGTLAAEAGLGMTGLMGATLAVLVLAILLGAFAATLPAGDWRRMAVRVMGSWIAAVGLLMVGWTLRG